MDELDFTLGNPQEDAPRRVQEKKKRNRRWLGLALLIAAVLGGVAAAILWDANSFDGLRRSVMYYRAEKDETGCALLYRYDSDKSSRFAALGGSLVSVSGSELQVIDEKSQVLYRQAVQFLSPSLSCGGERVAAYDIGGTTLYVLDHRGLAWQIETEGAIVDVTVNPQGRVTVVSHKSGCKAAVTVYDAAGGALFAYQSTSRFVMAAALSRDGATLCAVTMGQESGVFESFLVFYATDREEPQATVALDRGMVYELMEFRSDFCAVAEDGLSFLDTAGAVVSNYSFAGSYLRRCQMGNGFAAVLLSRYRSGTSAMLVTVDEAGNELAGCEADGEVLDLSAAGRYVAVLYSDRLVIYDKALTVLASLEDISDVRQVLMRSDGSAVLVGAASASLYLP